MNPFQPTRWEKDAPASALIWFSPQAYELTKPTSYYVSGTRGSGKTTLLRSIYWRDLLTNDSLKLQKHVTDFEHIGIYLRFPDFASSTGTEAFISRTFKDSPNPTLAYADIFSLIVETQCAARAIEACHELRLNKLILIAASDEQQIVATLLERYPELIPEQRTTAPTFKSLALALDRYSAQLNQALHRGRARSVAASLPAREHGVLLHFVCSQLSEFAQMKTPKGICPVAFRFCIDDCEVLSSIQQTILNTLVRVAKHPILWVVAYVGTLVNNRTTLIDAQPLTNADRTNIVLDPSGVEFDRGDFAKLCQSVVDFRIYYALSPATRARHGLVTPANIFPLSERLGQTRINDIFERVINRLLKHKQNSAYPQLLELKQAAIRISPKAPAQRASGAAAKSAPRYYEAYTLAHWLGREDAFSNTPDFGGRVTLAARQIAGDHALDAWLRKKQVGALLHFLSRFSPRPRIPLSGANVLLSLADGCIRDFLDVIGTIYDELYPTATADKDAQLEAFAFSQFAVSQHKQTLSLYKASRQFYQGIDTQIDEPRAVTALVQGLSTLTSLLQFNSRDIQTLSNPERGLFIIDFRDLKASNQPEDQQKAQFILDVLSLAELAGTVKSLSFRQPNSIEARRPFTGSDSIPSFRILRMHRRLSLEFNFSMRGAYAFSRVPAEQIAELCHPLGHPSPSKWAQSIYDKHFLRRSLETDTGQGELQLSISESDEVELVTPKAGSDGHE